MLDINQSFIGLTTSTQVEFRSGTPPYPGVADGEKVHTILSNVLLKRLPKYGPEGVKPDSLLKPGINEQEERVEVDVTVGGARGFAAADREDNFGSSVSSAAAAG